MSDPTKTQNDRPTFTGWDLRVMEMLARPDRRCADQIRRVRGPARTELEQQDDKPKYRRKR